MSPLRVAASLLLFMWFIAMTMVGAIIVGERLGDIIAAVLP